MTEAYAAHGGTAPVPGQTWFAAHEWAEFQLDDKSSATVVVCLMTGIFTIGLILYSIVALVCAA